MDGLPYNPSGCMVGCGVYVRVCAYYAQQLRRMAPLGYTEVFVTLTTDKGAGQGMELDNLRAVSQARVAEEKRMVERRRNTLVLIMRHLVDAGYVESYERLSAECNLSLQKASGSSSAQYMHLFVEHW
eukprot:1149254-Pelagomonas_calceolata.AAC.7